MLTTKVIRITTTSKNGENSDEQISVALNEALGKELRDGNNNLLANHLVTYTVLSDIVNMVGVRFTVFLATLRTA